MHMLSWNPFTVFSGNFPVQGDVCLGLPAAALYAIFGEKALDVSASAT